MNGEVTMFSSVDDILLLADNYGIQFSVVGDNLKIRLPKSGVSHDIIDAIKRHKPAIIAAIKQGVEEGKNRDSIQLVHIVDKRDKQKVPLTDLQESMWLAEKMSDTAGLLNYCSVTHIDKTPDLQALEYAYAKVIERHLPLRTSITEQSAGKKYQSEIKDYGTAIEYVDFSSNAGDFPAYLKKVAKTDFDFENGLKLALHLAKLNDNEFKLIVVMHHIATDGWSVGLLMEEIPFFYNQYLGRQDKSLPAIEVDYFDYAIWAQKQRESGAQEKGLQYWERRLSDAPTIHSVPTDFARPNALSFEVEYYYQKMPLEDLRNIQAFAGRQGVTLYSVLLSAYLVFLHKYSAEQHFVVGTSVANRTQEALSPLVGLFTNTLPMAFTVNQEHAFSHLLANVQKTYLADIEYQDIQLDRIIKRVKHDEMTLSYNPLVQIAFFVQNNDFPEFNFHGLDCSTTFVKTDVSLFDLTLSATEFSDSLELEWTYSVDLFNKSTVARMCNHYIDLLKQLMSAPDLPVKAARMLRDTELNTIVGDYARNQRLTDLVDRGVQKMLGDDCQRLAFTLFERQTEANPDKTALTHGDIKVSYRELNRQANRLAHYLICEQKIQVGDLVGIGLEKSVELIVSLLAIMKAGAAYLPLDPAFPPSRLAHMQQDSGASVVITRRALQGNISAGASLVCWDDNRFNEALERQPDFNPDVPVSDTELVYVIYTSGSTGQPKGVMIEHASLTNFLLSMRHEPGIRFDDRMLAVSSISFDIHTLEIFLPLVCGATVYIADTLDYADPSRLKAIMAKETISIMQATPSTWKILLDNGWNPQAPVKVLCGGEALGEDLKNRLLRKNNIELWNMYGPTEATVWCSVKKIRSAITLGKPAAGTSLYVLDDNHDIVPIGVRGQLYIGGRCLARGYMGKPALTEAAFTANIPEPIRESRIYRTGDYVKWNEEGELIYLGRRDSQLKIRGFRIEAGEIVKALDSLPYVRESAVVVKPGKEEGSKHLAAYLVAAATDSGKNIVDLARRDIQGVLPEYMIPTIMEQLDALPLTPNGKIDGEYLKRLEVATHTRSRVLPTTDKQKILAEMWADVLPVSIADIGIFDNFYELGGDSLSALVFVGRAKSRGLGIKPTDLLKYPTIDQLEKVCTDFQFQSEAARFTGRVPLTIDQKSALYDPITRQCFFINIVFDLQKEYDADRLRQALNIVADAHETLRANFHMDDNGLWQQTIQEKEHQPKVTLARMENVWKDCTDEQLRTLLSGIHAVIDIASGPLMAVALASDPAGEQKLFFSISHLVCDGFSLPVVAEDIFRVYASLGRREERITLPTYISIARWACEYDRFVNSEDIQSQLHYWENLDWKRLGKLPVDFKTVPAVNTISSCKHVTVQLEKKFTDLLVSPTLRTLGVDQMEILIHVLTRTISRWSGSQAVFLNVFDSGRSMVPSLHENEDLSRTVASFAIGRGMFLLAGKGGTARDDLLDTKNQIDAMPSRGYSYRALLHSVENTSVHARMKDLPQPEIWLNYYGVVEAIKAEVEDFPPVSALVGKIDVVAMKPEMPRNRTLFLPWNISDGKLNMVWEYSDRLHLGDSIAGLAESFKAELVGFLQTLHRELEESGVAVKSMPVNSPDEVVPC